MKKSLGNWVLNLGVFFLLVSWVVIVLIIQEDRRLETERAHRITHNLALVLEKHISGTFAQIESSLSLLRQNWEADSDIEKMHKLLKNFVAARFDLFNLISIIGPDGNVVVTNQDEFAATFSGDRPFFGYHAKNPGRDVIVGGPTQGRVTRKWYLPVSIRLNGPDGEFNGVLLASVNPYYFSMIFKEVALGREALVLLVDDAGIVYSGIHGGKELDLEFKMPSDKLARMFCKDNGALEIEESLSDGIKRIRSRSFIRDRSMAVSVETGYDEWFLQLRSRSGFLLALQTMLSLFIVMMILRLRRAVELREKISLELDRFFSSTIDLLCIIDKAGHFVRVNSAWEGALGYTWEELKQRRFIDFVHPDNIAAIEGFLVKLEEQQLEQGFAGQYRCKDGSYRWLEWKLSLQGDLFYASARDITEKLKVENALKNSELRFQTFMNMSPVYGYIKDDSLTHIYKNHLVIKLLEQAGEKGVLDSAQSVMNADTAKVVEDADRKIIAGTEARIELEYSLEVGNEIRWLKDVKFRLCLPDGRPAVGGLAFDITDQKRSEDERIKLQKLEGLGTLAGGIAHDFNNLLMAIFGNISVARMELGADHTTQKTLLEAEKALDRATALTRQLLTFARGGAPVKKVTDLGGLVMEAVKFDLTGSSVQPVFSVASDLWNADVDKGQIQQVFSNLTVNAVQAMEKGGRLFVTLENVEIREGEAVALAPGKYIRLTFADEGSGIAPEHLGQVFDPYFTTKKNGTGLGLATSHSIVKRHGGRIAIESELGRGTTFTIHLPASFKSVEPVVAEKTRQAETKRGSANILVLDDEEFIRRLVVEILQRHGYSTVAVSDGTEAVAAYKSAIESRRPFDLVIMDLTIPGGMGGKEAVKEILAIDPGACCIVSSGYSNDPVMANYAEFGFKGVAAKPYTIENLLAVVSRILEER